MATPIMIEFPDLVEEFGAEFVLGRTRKRPELRKHQSHIDTLRGLGAAALTLDTSEKVVELLAGFELSAETADGPIGAMALRFASNSNAGFYVEDIAGDQGLERFRPLLPELERVYDNPVLQAFTEALSSGTAEHKKGYRFLYTLLTAHYVSGIGVEQTTDRLPAAFYEGDVVDASQSAGQSSMAA